MTPFIAVLEFTDFLVIAFLIIVFGSGTAIVARQRVDLRGLDRKLDALLKHQGVSLPPILSDEVQGILRDASKKPDAIKLHREQTGLDEADATADVEAFLAGKR